MGNRSPKVDAYIAKTKPFAQPILEHLRDLVHKGCPDVEEAMKWSMPFFVYKGAILGNMSGFKEHCHFGFWDKGMAEEVRNSGQGPLRRVTTLKDLPSDKQLLGWIRQAASNVDRGEYQSPIAARNTATAKAKRATKPQLDLPAGFAAALKKNKAAAAGFKAFSPSCRREYVEWIVDAKRDETRAKRIATAVEWIAEGKQRNWKYQ
jgi:uncharacterized protein YdeI (YjbR/CyaY-like superfamily)